MVERCQLGLYTWFKLDFGNGLIERVQNKVEFLLFSCGYVPRIILVYGVWRVVGDRKVSE